MMIYRVSVQQTKTALESFDILRCPDKWRERYKYPDLTVERLVPLSHHKIGCVPHKAANTLQPIQVLLVLNLKREIYSFSLTLYFMDSKDHLNTMSEYFKV